MSCWFPAQIRNNSTKSPYAYLTVPCGKCHYCRLRKLRGWIMRLKYEEKRHWYAYFVTLTYANPPLSKKGLPTLRKKCLQLFFKRLRKNDPEINLKYYAVGEYGSNYRRPHYHLIIFGVAPSAIEKAWSGIRPKCAPSVLNGYVHIGDLTSASVAYTLKYVDKKGQIPMFEGDDRLKEFSLISQRMGANYLTDENIKYHQNALTPIWIDPQTNDRITLPRYYADKIFNDKQKFLINKTYEKFISERYALQVSKSGSEELYYSDLHARIRAHLQKIEIDNKQKRKFEYE